MYVLTGIHQLPVHLGMFKSKRLLGCLFRMTELSCQLGDGLLGCLLGVVLIRFIEVGRCTKCGWPQSLGWDSRRERGGDHPLQVPGTLTAQDRLYFKSGARINPFPLKFLLSKHCIPAASTAAKTGLWG